MLKAKEASPRANKRNTEDTKSWFITILYEYPNSTARRMQQLIEEKYEIKLTRQDISRNLRSIVREGIIESEPTKSGNVYRIVGADN